MELEDEETRRVKRGGTWDTNNDNSCREKRKWQFLERLKIFSVCGFVLLKRFSFNSRHDN